MKNPDQVVDAQYYFDRGNKMIERRDYLKAVTDFQTVTESYSNSDLVDHAQFMLAESYFLSEEYLTAAYEYERVYTDYSTSEFSPEAQYKKALCYYMESPIANLDQENTLLAIDEFNRFIDNYPRQERVKDSQEKIDELTAKLAYKEYLNAEQYKNLKIFDNHLDSALIYYRIIITDYPRTVWADYARLGVAEVYLLQSEYEQAKVRLTQIVTSNVEPALIKKAGKMLEKIEQIEKR